MTINAQELIEGIEEKNSFPLDQAQKQAITYGNGPLLIAAGPGTGKTEVLVARCLKFICCDGVAPGSIILTTFTEKAAKNLEDRLSAAFLFLPKSIHNLQKLIHPHFASTHSTDSATIFCKSIAILSTKIFGYWMRWKVLC